MPHKHVIFDINFVSYLSTAYPIGNADKNIVNPDTELIYPTVFMSLVR